MDVSIFDRSKWLKAGDLPALSQVWTIKDVRAEMVGDEEKPVVYFHQHAKGLGLNKINRETLVERYSKFSESWLGQPCEVYQDKTQYQGKLVDCIRLRIPPAAPVAPAAAPQPVAQQPQPVAVPQPPAAVPQAQPQAPWVADDQQHQKQSSPPSA